MRPDTSENLIDPGAYRIDPWSLVMIDLNVLGWALPDFVKGETPFEPFFVFKKTAQTKTDFEKTPLIQRRGSKGVSPLTKYNSKSPDFSNTPLTALARKQCLLQKICCDPELHCINVGEPSFPP